MGSETLQMYAMGWQPCGVPTLAKAIPNPAKGSGIEGYLQKVLSLKKRATH
jgi:hypothetical protein